MTTTSRGGDRLRSHASGTEPSVTKATDHGTDPTRFRRDIQGLRAIAVLAVLAWHAEIPGVETGFVGVDVFFVVSGFLISGLLLRERVETGRVDLIDFYARRAKRLLPAAGLVLVATTALTVAFVPRIRWRSIADETLTSALYVQNWALAGRSVDYLSEGAAPSPLQHYWSLAVEEQFYIVWPLLVFVATPSGSIRRGSFRIRLLALCGVVVLASFIHSVTFSSSSPGPAYFATTTRAWQFAVGALLAFAVATIRDRDGYAPRARAATPMAAIGLIAVIGAALQLPSSQPFPGWIAAVPTLGTAALILAGTRHGDNAISRALSVGPMVWIGGLSYALYLWHWPLLVTLEAAYGPFEWPTKTAVVIASFAPAMATNKFFENPLRHATFLESRNKALGAGLVATGVGVVGAVVLIGLAPQTVATQDRDVESALSAIEALEPGPTEAADDNSNDEPASTAATIEPAAEPELRLGAVVVAENGGVVPEQRATSERIIPDPFAAAEDRGDFIGCSTPLGSDELQECVGEVSDAGSTVVLVGDSIAHQWATGVSAVADAAGWNFSLRTKSACAYTGLDALRNGLVDTDCVAWNIAVHEMLLETRPDVVVFTGRDRGAIVDGAELNAVNVREAQVEDHVGRWNELEAAGIRVVVLSATPNPSTNVPECVSENLDSLIECVFVPPAFDGSATALEAAAIEGGFDLVSLNDRICRPDSCPVVIGDVLVYRDGAHLSDTYVRTLTPALADRLELQP